MASKKGSKKEGGLDPDKHAKWTPRRRCHSYEDLKVTEIRWIKVLMANPTATGWANFGIGLFRVLQLTRISLTNVLKYCTSAKFVESQEDSQPKFWEKMLTASGVAFTRMKYVNANQSSHHIV